MAPTRPEFFYHPVTGVVSPASLGLFAFKQGPLVLSNPPLSSSNLAASPKPLVRVTAPDANGATATLPKTLAESVKIPVEPDMKKPARNSAHDETCIVTGETYPHSEMIRFVIDPDNNIVPDLADKLPGTGYWVLAKRDLLKKAVWRNSFTTAARTQVNVDKDLPEKVSIGLLKQSLETIGLARKAGIVTAGFAKAEEVLENGKAVLYLVASDAKENGREKLEKLALRQDIPVLDLWTSSQLSAALGEDNAVHVVFGSGGLTDKLKIIAQKLKDIR